MINLEEVRKSSSNSSLILSEKDKKIQELENKIALLSSELERLKTFMDNYKREIEEWKLKYINLQQFETRSKEYEQKLIQ